jgi:hypothetical protein
MGKLIVVENDKVEGTDTHKVAGIGPNPGAPPPTANFKGTGRFDYKGKMTDQLSDFVNIDGKPVALKSSKSSLNSGESALTGKHGGPNGSGYAPGAGSVATQPTAASLSITDSVGPGNPSSSAGSIFVKIASTAVLLDGDKIDTCDALSAPMNSTVTAEKQSFVFCST